MTLSPEDLNRRLPVEGLGQPLYFFISIGSTNDYAKELAQKGAPHGTLVVADEQTAGRGRAGRSWSTPPGTALAMSLLVRPDSLAPESSAPLTGVGALAVAEAIRDRGGEPQIKWPNDVLIAGRKTAGILVETQWEQKRIESAVIGIGVNVRAGSAPPDEDLDYPATDLETALEAGLSRTDLLVDILEGLTRWLGEVGKASLVSAWERYLFALGQIVKLEGPGESTIGELLGLTPGGHLRLKLPDGEVNTVGPEIRRLRPVDIEDG